MMASPIGEESYTFNLEWIERGSGIGEEICGVDKDCIVVPTSPGLDKGVVEDRQLEDDYVEIQVTEEEVVADQWQDNQNGSEEYPMGFHMEVSHDEVVVPLPEDQDEYSRLHPYPCDFCSRRFSKKSALTAHMVFHQLDKSYGCNICGAQYHRKLRLVEHMKIHAYAPEKTFIEEDYDSLPTVHQAKEKQKARRKKGKLSRSDDITSSGLDVEKPLKKNKKNYTESPQIEQHYVEDEMSLVLDLGESSLPQRYPIIDPNRPYVCQSCGIGFAREKALISHNMIHAGDSAYECERCHDMFQSHDQLIQHEISKHGVYGFQDKRVTNNDSSDDKFGSFHCDQCDTWFRWYTQYKKHKRTHEKSADNITVESLSCSLCNLVYNTIEELQLHKEEVHNPDIGVHSCDTCGEVYEHLYELHEHVKTCNKTLHSCSICDSVFKNPKDLSRHSLMHIEGHSYACLVCSRRFCNKGKLRRHLLMHEEQKRGFVCKDCGDEFADGRTLISHRQDIHGVNMSRLFPCMECGKTFGSRSSQQIHVRIHTGEKPYGCRYCWKAFADGGTLRKHERIHTGEKPYVCPVCSKAFNQRVVLREHVRAHHSGERNRFSANCYECIVCGQMFGTSSELCLHLVQHSDENTAKHRLPNTSLRKCPRKKKIPSPVVNQPLFQSDMFEFSETSRDSTDFSKDKKIAILNKRTSEENLESVVKLVESPIVDTVNSAVAKPNMKRARIVRSGKKGYPKGNNKRFMKGKGKAARLMNNTSYASKYVVSRPNEGDNSTMQNLLEAVDASCQEEPINGYLPPPRNRPRTKNVSYHNMKGESKFELATFPVQPEPKSKKSKKVPKVKIKKEQQSIDTQFINGIDPSLFEENHSGEQIETCIDDDIGVELKLEVKTTEPDEYPMLDNITIKTEEVSCEMCSEVFSNRSDLLKHIQVHI